MLRAIMKWPRTLMVVLFFLMLTMSTFAQGNPYANYPLGVITVGDGTTSHGIFDVTNYKTSGNTDVALCLAQAVTDSRKLRLLPGTYTFRTKYSTALDNIDIEGSGEATNLVLDGTNTDAVGMFEFTGENSHLSNMKITVSGWNNSQVAVRLAGSWQRIRDVKFEMTTTAGNNSTPMRLIKMENALNPVIENCVVLPNTGARCVEWLYGHGGKIINSAFRNTSQIGYGGSEPPVPRRNCEQVIRGIGNQFITVENNMFWGLGTVTSNELVECCYFQRDSDNAGTNPNIADNTFQGTIVFKNNIIGYVACPTQLRLRGIIDWVCEGNTFGSSDGAINAAGEGALFLDTESATSTGETGICGVGVVRNNLFEGCALTAGSAIQAKRVKKTIFEGNNFHAGTCAKFINLNIDDSSTLMFRSNYFDGDEQTTQWGIGFDSPSLALTPRLISIRDNCGDGLLFGVCPGRISVNYTTGASNWPQGTQYDDGSLNNWVAPVSNLGNQPVIDLTTSVLSLPTDLYTLPAVSTFADANKCLQILAARVNRMSLSNEMALGLFATSQFLLTDNSGGTGNAIIANVTDLATLKDGIADCALAINNCMNPQKASTLEVTRRKYLATMVNAAGDANGFAVIDDSAVSASANAAGVVTTACTDAATGKVFLATIAQALKRNIQHISTSSNVCWRTSASN